MRNCNDLEIDNLTKNESDNYTKEPERHIKEEKIPSAAPSSSSEGRGSLTSKAEEISSGLGYSNERRDSHQMNERKDSLISSVPSNNISINSIRNQYVVHDDDDSSSFIDSDSEFEDLSKNGDYIIQKLGQHSNINPAELIHHHHHHHNRRQYLQNHQDGYTDSCCNSPSDKNYNQNELMIISNQQDQNIINGRPTILSTVAERGSTAISTSSPPPVSDNNNRIIADKKSAEIAAAGLIAAASATATISSFSPFGNKDNHQNYTLHSRNLELGNASSSSLSSSPPPPRPSLPEIGSIAVQNSSDVTFGNKTFYQGPVTIKQFLLENKPSTGAGGPDTNNSPENQDNPDAPNKYPQDRRKVVHPKWKVILKSRSVIILGIITILIIAICTITFLTLKVISSNADDPLKNEVVRIINRDEWNAQPPREKGEQLILPVSNIIIAETQTEGCLMESECSLIAWNQQRNDIEKYHLNDIRYNFLIGGDGAVYEGRGWFIIGDHTENWNNKSLSLTFMGVFEASLPREKQIHAVHLLLQEGIRSGKIERNYKLFGQRQLGNYPGMPGRKLFDLIETWPHWSDKVDNR